MQASLIVAAGGSGSRFQKTLEKKTPAPKLFHALAGRPLLAHAVSAFQKIPQITETILAAPQELQPQVRNLVKKNKWRGVKVIAGGKTRAESVYKALQKTSRRNEWVMVHDGARPFVSLDTLQKLFAAAAGRDAVLLGKKVVPTLKEADEKGLVKRTVDRSVLYEAETPQLVRRHLLEKAYRDLPDALQATDEASLVEGLQAEVHLVTHEGWNPKITTSKDLELAEAFLSSRAVTLTGFGRDTHRLVPKRKFWLGGVRLPFHKGPLGHSDGDALLHAVTDAVLGATGSGDIGEWFSDKNPKYKNIASRKMLQAVLKEAAAKGFRILHVDTVIVLEKPKLGPYKRQIKKKLAGLLNLPEDSVSIKAKTAEGLGPEGEGRAVTCEALVTMKKDPCLT